MLRNFITIALRNIQRNAVYSFINIFGLALGLTSAILILLWIQDEVSYDQFHTNKNQLFQVFKNYPTENGIGTARSMPLPLLEEFKTNEPGIRYATATDFGQTHLLRTGDKKLMQSGLFASEDFLAMFSFPLMKGDATKALKDPNGIVLTHATARALFGDADAMGKVVQVDESLDMIVTGVLEDIPANSSIQFEYLLPFSAYIATESFVKRSLTDWQTNAFQMYVQLNDHSDIASVEERVKGVIMRHASETRGEVTFHGMPRWRLYSQFVNGKSAGGTIEFVRAMYIVSGFILLIACINFMNLATARSERRAREVGIRKSVGSRRWELIAQFMGESIMTSLLAFMLAVVMSEILLPFYNQLVDKQLSIPYGNYTYWLAALTIILATGLIAGSYPALYLSSFKPAAVLKGTLGIGKKSTPRKVLVTLQFSFAIFHIIGAIVFYQQIQYGKDRYLGYDQNNLLMVQNSGDLASNFNLIRKALTDQGLASGVIRSNSPITQVYAYMNPRWAGLDENQYPSFATFATEYDYTKTLGIKVLEGRDFDEKFNDSTSILLNQAAVEQIGWDKPIGQQILWNEKTYTVVGVVQNALSSPYQQAEPTMIIFDPLWMSDITIRIAPTLDLPKTLTGIENIFKQYNPAYPFTYRFADEEFSRKFTSIQMIGKMANIFSTLTVVISCLGLFGLSAYTTEQRSKEIGIRKVMGASVTHIVMLLSKDFTKLVLIAFVMSAPAAWWLLDGWLQRFPYRIQITGAVVIVAGVSALVLALTTVSSHALKAAVENPVKALRSE